MSVSIEPHALYRMPAALPVLPTSSECTHMWMSAGALGSMPATHTHTHYLNPYVPGPMTLCPACSEVNGMSLSTEPHALCSVHHRSTGSAFMMGRMHLWKERFSVEGMLLAI